MEMGIPVGHVPGMCVWTDSRAGVQGCLASVLECNVFMWCMHVTVWFFAACVLCIPMLLDILLRVCLRMKGSSSYGQLVDSNKCVKLLLQTVDVST
jgi:hypothetical protein